MKASVRRGIGIAILITTACLVVRAGFNGAREALAQERRLYAGVLACMAIEGYLDKSGYTAWPSSWADIESVSLNKSMGPYGWPQDSVAIQKFVIVDFAAQLDELAKQSPDDFTGVRVNGSVPVTFKIAGTDPLLAELKKHRSVK